MKTLGYDINDTSTSYAQGSPAALGNYIAQCYIAYGLGDGANEANGYATTTYAPVNPPLEVEKPGNPNVVDLNRWQAITLSVSIDQSGNPVQATPPFLSPEWGAVHPFAMTSADMTICSRTGFNYPVYHDPGAPPTFNGPLAAEYKWSHSLVAVWSSHLDPTKGRGADLVDVSPASLGNIQKLSNAARGSSKTATIRLLGGTPGAGYAVNPATGQPYQPQIVPLGDYARVVAEFSGGRS